ncbi:hypothetical protein ACHAPT_009953 [Fusarium lateritium]
MSAPKFQFSFGVAPHNPHHLGDWQKIWADMFRDEFWKSTGYTTYTLDSGGDWGFAIPAPGANFDKASEILIGLGFTRSTTESGYERFEASRMFILD